jgi:hypothetical protein
LNCRAGVAEQRGGGLSEHFNQKGVMERDTPALARDIPPLKSSIFAL